VLTSKCLRTASAEVLSVGPIVLKSNSPALETRTSTLVMPCSNLSSSTASEASVADVESTCKFA
jgi:hypothetical protein